MNPYDTQNWDRLDNAAKIFPSNSNKTDTKVFRFTCTLKKQVREDLLKAALTRTLEEFPFYNCVIRPGLFWFYLEESPLEAEVTAEENPPCAPLFGAERDTLLFQVSFYHKKINLEVYHALSDGAGALQFLKTLVCFYLSLGEEESADSLLALAAKAANDASVKSKSEDSFQKYYAPDNRLKKAREPLAYRIKGDKIPEGRMRIIQGRIPVASLLQLARQKQATLSVFLGSILLRAIADDMPVRKKKRPVVLSVPVDLRGYFASATMRNFFGVIHVGYDFSAGPGTLEDILSQLKRRFAQELTLPRLERRMSAYTAMEKNPLIRIIPLPVKNFFMMWAGKWAHLKSTCSFSNLGVVRLPDPFAGKVEDFAVMASTDRLSCCLCSYDDTLCISFTSIFESTNIQKNFFRTLASLGLEVHIQANIVGEEAKRYEKKAAAQRQDAAGKPRRPLSDSPDKAKRKEQKKRLQQQLSQELKAHKNRRRAARARLIAYRREKKKRLRQNRRQIRKNAKKREKRQGG